MDASQSVGGTSEAQQLRLLADDLLTLLQRERPRLEHLPGFWKAELHARTALGLLRYHANMARPDAARKTPDRLATMLSLRDLMMADNLQAIAEREREHGPTLVFAHNLHLQREVSGLWMGEQRMEWWSAGAQLSRRLGTDYAFIASGMGRATTMGIGDPAHDTPEGQLMQLPDQISLLTRAELNVRLDAPLTKRTDFPPQAFPLKPETLSGVDGLLFVKDAMLKLSE
ncbi:hypothetical protein GCM10017783_26120 [Deinococcus piscis]|uniref:Erythromycin esterase n=2 Tax=Deinococcus piscis TaxID=394230 RepID=A0ABQ3KCR1_9DEIO|nr:hypothetical protein GCM10017783_26120 [Deinococcus piscis]